MWVGFSARGSIKGYMQKSWESQGNILGSGKVTLVRLELAKEKISVPAGTWDLAVSSVPEGWELYQLFLLPIARTVSPEQPSYAQPYTREFKKRDDISCTAVL